MWKLNYVPESAIYQILTPLRYGKNKRLSLDQAVVAHKYPYVFYQNSLDTTWQDL